MYNTRIITVALVVLGIGAPISAQKIVRLDPYEKKYDPGVVLVKFEENVGVPLNQEGRLGKMALTNTQNTLAKYGIERGEVLFPAARRSEKLGKVKMFSGEESEAKSLYNIVRFRFDPKYDAKIVAEEIAAQEGVAYAEPDYIFAALETVPNDAHYGLQWYLPLINALAAWDSTKSDTTQIIGIIDTGVDWDHADLADKIKINWAEYNGKAGVDDDGNGFVDDIRGWDFISNDNNPNDDNSHGTHVAGIAAAETNNSIGISGVGWNAKILPVKVLQSTGYGSASVVAQGVDYARRRGATVINLSLGGYSESITLRTALENAFSTAVIVAAAGNDGIPIEYDPVRKLDGAPMFPGCYGWVIGVEATKQTWDDKYGWRTSFSNYDPSGPVSYNNSYGYNYELKAPGASIYSTLPNGQYGYLSGTSMAAPMVSGAVTLLKSRRPSMSNELLLGNLINGLSTTLNIYTAMNQNPSPNLQYISHTLIDTLTGCDRDGRPDAGERIQIWLTVQNTWGDADSVWTKLRLNPLEDPSVATITDSTSFIINGLSTYATATGKGDPFTVQLASDLANNRQIIFNYEIGCKNSGVKKTGSFSMTIQKGQEISGFYTGLMHLTADKFYIVPSSAVIDSLIIDPGCEIHVAENASINVNNFLLAEGTPDSMILFTHNGSGYWKGIRNMGTLPFHFKYCIFEFARGVIVGCCGWSISSGQFENCIFRYNIQYLFQYLTDSYISKSNFIDNNGYVDNLYNTTVFENNIIVNNNTNGEPAVSSHLVPSYVHRNNIIYNNNGPSYGIGWPEWGTYHAPPQYYGTTNRNEIESLIRDFFEADVYPVILGDSALTVPPALAHGIVWKVMLNGKNPHEETLDPIGMETVRFDVYFNRAMDVQFEPFLTFGGREPYTQHLVEDSAGWSSDSTVWHGYYTVGLETGDGINTVRVSGAKDVDHFEIPIEDTRFKFVIDAAGSAANDFLANAWVGKVTLNWPKAPTEDVLGYNLYRYYNLTDSTYSPTERINTALITDTTYTDFAVIPDTTYHYMYKILGTDMAESDYSKLVTATPIKASSGDANGDLSVNVLDVVSTVSFILGQTPQPFIFAAADINNDTTINVLDIVGIVNVILHPGPAPGMLKTTAGIARLNLRGDEMILTSDVSVSAVQFRFEGKGLKDVQFVPDTSIGQFEVASNTIGDSVMIVISYNMTGTTIAQGNTRIGSFPMLPPTARLTEGIVADRQGKNVLTKAYNNGETIVPEEYYLSQNYPNPFNMSTTIRFGLPELTKARMLIYNVLGQKVRTIDLGERAPGRYETTWDGMNEGGRIVSSGVYFYRLEANKSVQAKKLLLLK